MTEILIDVQDIKDVVAGDNDLAMQVHRALCDLADELNSALEGYKVQLVHLDTGDYLGLTAEKEEEPKV